MPKKLLYSPGYGAGWSTWASHDIGKFMVSYGPIITFLDEGGTFTREDADEPLHPVLAQFVADCEARFGESPYLGGADDLAVLTVDDDVAVKIHRVRRQRGLRDPRRDRLVLTHNQGENIMLYEIEWMSDEGGLPDHYGSTIVEAPDPEITNFTAFDEFDNAFEAFRWTLPLELVRHAEWLGRDWARAHKCDFVVHVSGYTPARFGFEERNGGSTSWRYLEFREPHARKYDETRAARLAVID